MRFAVIGAGWAGLAAAVELSGAGAAVTLYEAGRVAGGRARSIQCAGRTLDNGQHILLGAYRDTLALMEKVGANPQRSLQRLPLQVCDSSGFRLALPKLPAPLHLALGLFGATAVNLPEKLKTAWWMQRIQWRNFRLNAVDAGRSVADWLDAAGQTGELRRHLWEPLCLAALNTPVQHASAQIFANVLRDSLGSAQRSDTDLLLPRVPFGELLPEPALRWLSKQGAELRFGQRVRELHGTQVDGQAFDAVIVALAPQHAARLLPAEIPDFHHEPMVTVYLQYPENTRLSFPLYHLNGKYSPWVVDRGNGLFGCVISGHGDWEQLTDDALAQELHEALRQLLPALTTPLWQRVICEKRATFSCRPQQARPSHVTAHPGVFLAGDYTWADYPATLEGAVRSGLRAARAALGASVT